MIQLSPDLHTAVLADPLVTLRRWAELGWLRRLDCALAALMRELDPAAAPALLVATAFLAHMEGHGHTCLPLTRLVSNPNAVLQWPEAAQEDLSDLWTTLPNGLVDWLHALQSSPLVRIVEAQLMPSARQIESDHGQPLILGGTLAQPLLYLRRYWLHERQVVLGVLNRVAATHIVEEKVSRRWLDRLFDPVVRPDEAADKNDVEINWQKLACALALRSSLTVITGGPGTGKTYTAARLLALLVATNDHPQGLRVALAAPTGKASARLRQSIDGSLKELSSRLGDDLDLPGFTQRMGAARTLHSLLGARADTRALDFNASHLLDLDILIVDEASMIHLEMMSALLQAMPLHARLILMGDKDQLASVEAGAVLGDLCRDAAQGNYTAETSQYLQRVTGQSLAPEFVNPHSAGHALSQQTVMLRTSRRFGGQIGQLALAVNQGQASLAQHLLTQNSSGELFAPPLPRVSTVLELAMLGRPGGGACYADYLRLVNARPQLAGHDPAHHEVWVKSVLLAFDQFRILCAVHEGDWGTRSLNQAIAQTLKEAKMLTPRGEWFAGKPVMVTRNDPQLGVFNGDVGVALPSCQGSGLRVYFLDGERLRSVGVSHLAHTETAFAMTVHKSQGSEFCHTVLVLPEGGAKVLTRELVYTGITRARQSLTLIEGQPGLLQRAIARPSWRASGVTGA